MLNGEELFEFRATSPSFSDSSFGSFHGLDESEDLQLFPGIKNLSKQSSIESDGSEDAVKKRNIVAVRLDPNKEKELIDYLIGKSDGSDNCGTENRDFKVLSNGKVLRKIQTENFSSDSGLQHNTALINVRNADIGSDIYSSEATYRGKCMSKNAVAARENRLRKKTYVADLEQTVKSLTAENTTLKSQVATMKESVEDLNTEVRYLRNVLANQSTLSALLKNIPSVPGINLVSSVSKIPEPKSSRKRLHEDDNDGGNIIIDYETVVPETKDVEVDFRTESGHQYMPTRSQIKKIRKLDHSYATKNAALLEYQTQNQPKLKHQDNSTDGAPGVCLHVSGSRVSLEFCAHCNGNNEQ